MLHVSLGGLVLASRHGQNSSPGRWLTRLVVRQHRALTSAKYS